MASVGLSCYFTVCVVDLSGILVDFKINLLALVRICKTSCLPESLLIIWLFRKNESLGKVVPRILS